jgi:RND family efflux transporter MFP subunit
MNKKSQSIYLSLGAVAASFLLVACGNKSDPAGIPSANAASAPAGGRATGAPISVTTVIAKQRSFDVSLEAIGTVTPLSSVDVKPQINSVVTQVHVKEGQFVKAGELLFTLDARPDVANVAKVRAQMVKDQAVLDDAQRQLTRSRDLLAKSFISQGALDTAQAQVDSQQANLVADRAALDAAQLALSYNSVRASGAGRLGAVNVYPGTAVQANVTPLVTITQLDPINIGFSLPQSNLGAALEGLSSGGAAVIATLPDAKTSLKGRLQFVDNAVDAATGTVKVKARFDNADGKLWPGAFVNVALNSQTLQDAVVIPTTAIIQSARGPIVYIVDKGTAALRPVKVVASQGEDSAVTGIAAGNKVVVEGRQNLRPDAAVIDRTSSPAAPARAAASATP